MFWLEDTVPDGPDGCIQKMPYYGTRPWTIPCPLIPEVSVPHNSPISFFECPWGAPDDGGFTLYRSTLAASGLARHLRPLDAFSILNDWATILRASHASGVVHGNLTPESVGIVHGEGILINRGRRPNRGLSRTREALEEEDDIYGARWAATELFRLDGNPCPTKMSDVYSFACLMLQMLTGSVPYCGTKRPEQVVYLKYLGREPIDAQTPKVADRYVAFMRRCWSPEPENRPTMDTIVSFIHEEIKRLGE